MNPLERNLSENKLKQTPEFMSQVKSGVEEVFGSFNTKIIESVQKTEGWQEFWMKYGNILGSFGELQKKVSKWFEYAAESPNLSEADFEAGVEDLKKIMGKLTFITSEWDKNPENFDVSNVEQHGKLRSSYLDIKQENLKLVFNFEEDDRREARAAVTFNDEEGREYSIRFDLDKKLNKVVCDVQAEALEKIFKRIETRDGSHTHHFVMEELSEYVFEHNNNQEKRERFREVVEKFKEFLVGEDVWQAGMLQALVNKFNS